MDFIKKIFIFTSILSVFAFAKKVEHAKIMHSDIYSTTIEFELDDFQLIPVQTEKGIMQIVKINNGASMLNKGAPDIPKYSRSIIIPDDAKMQYEILSSKYIDYENVLIAPSKGNFTRKINPNSVMHEFGNEYDKNEFYPGSLVELQSPYVLRNLRGQAVDIRPIHYNPITKILRVYESIEIKVFANGAGSANVLNRSASNKFMPREYKNIYEGHFINFNNDSRFDYLDDHGSMLIISYGDFMEEMQPFVDWKNRKGIPTEMINVAEIGLNSTAIETFVDNYYYENGLTFLLLVGDVSQIPSPSISGSASDPSYGFIEGNDSYAEVIVGRFSGSTPAHIATQVERSINYERFPEDNADWYDNAMGVASTQGPGYGGYTDDEFNDFLWNDILSDFTYDSYQYSYDGSGSVSQGMDIINNGVSFINYTGHGSISSWGNGAPLSTSDVNSLTNNDMLPFIISVACNNGEFNSTNECFGESWLRATHDNAPSGGIGFYGSTISMSWEPPMHGQYAMNLILTESYENHITRSMGGITTNGCLYMNDAQGSSGMNETNYWTLFGDPSLEVRTDQPASLSISHDAAIVLGQSEMIVNTGVSNALVALSKENELLTFAYSENGNATLNLDDLDLIPGDYDLVVTSFNAYPHETMISVISPEGPYVTFDSYVINDSFAIGGNGNGMVEFDETISLALSANNVGVDDAHNVSAQVSTSDEYAVLGSNQVNFGDINAGSSITAGSIDMMIAHNVPDGHQVSLSVLFDSDEGQWEGNFNIPIYAPSLTVSNPSFVDFGGDGIWDAGEAITVTVLLNNEGSTAHYNYPGVVLSENSDEASILDGYEFFWFYGIEVGMTMAATFSVTASENANMGSVVDFTAYATELNCQENCIESEEISFSFTIGLPYDEDLHEPLNLVAELMDGSIYLSWDEPFQCPEGYIADCIGQCIEDWYEAWLGDGLCDDGTWGVYFNCEEFNNDGGDCGDTLTCEDQGLVTCPNGSCEASIDDCPDTSCGLGEVDDCADNDCCPESWIGDGLADCEDQAYGCDLSCYDNDGGDCGGRNDSISHQKTEQMYPDRLTADFSDAVMVQKNSRDVDGYFVYRDNLYLAFTEELNYNDIDINSGMDYCYHVTAVYEEGQSIPSNISCVETQGQVLGDVNGDNMLNVQDLVLIVNMILGEIDIDYLSADVNGDGVVNIQDLVILANTILGRTSINHDGMGTKAFIHEENDVISISSDGLIAGIQIDINTKNMDINENLPMDVSYRENGENKVILIYGLHGETLSGEKIELLSNLEDYIINSITVANVLGDVMRVDLMDTFLPKEFILGQNYPNPFNPITSINFTLRQTELLNLNIYDVQGRLIKTLIDNEQFVDGSYQFIWDGKNNHDKQVPSGMYLYELMSEDQLEIKKMILMK